MADETRLDYATDDTVGLRADKLTYNEILDHNAIVSLNTGMSEYVKTSEVQSTVSATGTDPVNGTAVSSALSGYVTTTQGNNLEAEIKENATNISTIGGNIRTLRTDVDTNTDNISNKQDRLIAGSTTSATGGLSEVSAVMLNNIPAIRVQTGSYVSKDSLTYSSYKYFLFSADTNENTELTVPDKSGTIALTSDISDKQDTLVSGTNIKTINNQSLLGSGNITIEGGSSTDTSNLMTLNTEQTVTGAKTYDTTSSLTVNGDFTVNAESTFNSTANFGEIVLTGGWGALLAKDGDTNQRLDDYVEVPIKEAASGTIAEYVGLDSSGNIVKSTAPASVTYATDSEVEALFN